MASALSRQITAKMSSGEGYKPGGTEVNFNKDISAGTAYSASVSRIKVEIATIKTFSGRSRFTIYVNGNNIGTTQWFNATGGTLSTLTSDYSQFSLGSGKDSAISASVSSVVVKVETEGNTYFYNSSDGNTQLTITVQADVGDPTAPTVVTLNGTNGNINVLAGSSVTIAWSGASGAANNPITGYQVLKNGSVVTTTTNTSYTVNAPSAGNSDVYTIVSVGSRSNSGASAGRSVYAYTNPTPPNKVQISSDVVDAGATATLSWSGASNGSGNAIQSYQVFRSTSAGGTYSAYGNAVSGTALAVPAPSTMGESYFYKVRSNGQYSNSGLSDAYIELTARVYTAVSAPTNVVCTPNVITADGIVSLSWSGAEGGTNTNVASYQVHRSVNRDSGYTLLGTTTANNYSVTAPDTAGQTYYYRIIAVADKSGFDSALSDAYGYVSVPLEPNQPVIQGTISGKSYNSRPRVLAQIPPVTVEGVIQSVVAPGWTASRMNLEQGQKVVLRKDTAYSSSGTNDVTFVSRDSFGVETGKVVSVKHEVPVWTDDPVTAGTTAIKASHMNELRQAINDLRAWYGMDVYTWQEEIVAGVTSSVNWAGHAIEIKEQIEAIQRFINEWDSTNTALDVSLPTISTFYAPKADVINKLRDAIKLL